MRYKHNYNNGDMIFDIEYKEVFEPSDKSDGYLAQEKPKRLRLATSEEIDLHNKSKLKP